MAAATDVRKSRRMSGGSYGYEESVVQDGGGGAPDSQAEARLPVAAACGSKAHGSSRRDGKSSWCIRGLSRRGGLGSGLSRRALASSWLYRQV
jgi:hypothetical protein